MMLGGTSIYEKNAANFLPPRDVEAAAFEFVNRMLSEATDAAARIRALNRNHRLWSLLLGDVGLSGNQLPPILKKDLTAIGAWSMSYSTAAMGRALPIQPLLDVNRDMIEALRSSNPAPAVTRPPARSSVAVAV